MPSIIDQRLAAEMHKRQIETLVKAEGVANRVAGGIQEAADRWLQVVTADADIAIRLRLASRLWHSHFMQIAPTIDDQFRRLIGWSHEQQVKAYAAVIPRRWFRKVSPEVAVMTNLEDAGRLPIPGRQVIIPGQQVGPLSGGDIRANVITEPIADSTERMSDEEWQRVLREVVFPPPTRAEVEQMLHTKGPDGISWQGRFEALSRRISDIDRMSQELIVGFSNGENLQQLKKRALPLVEGIQSSAKRIVRTEGLRIAEQVQRRSWDGLGDMMQGAQVLAVLDQNTRPEHAARNGTIYYEQPRAGQKSMAELPMLPDQPNCRCWSTPVLQPPKELENDPEVAAAFANDAGAGIPDPASYDKWFETADPERRMMAVGARRYRAVQDMLRGLREPEWTDFIDSDGELLPVSTIKSESAADRAARKYEVGEVIRKRGEQVKAIAAKGFLVQGDIGPAGPRPVLPPVLPPTVAPPTAPPVLPPVQPPTPPVVPPIIPPVVPPVVPPQLPVVAPRAPEPAAAPAAAPTPTEKPPLAKNIKEAKKIAERFNIADVVDFTGLDVEIANDMIQGISDAISDFPELRKNLKFIGSSQARNKYIMSVKLEETIKRLRDVTGNEPDKATIDYAKKRLARQIGRVPGDAYAYSTGDDLAGGISVNSKYGKTAAKMREMLARDVRAGFHPPGCDTVRSVVDHEMAHEIDKLLGLATRREFTDQGLYRIVSQYSREQIGVELSGYAKTNPKEVIAEAWAEYKNNPQPREIATKIGDYIRSRRTAQTPAPQPTQVTPPQTAQTPRRHNIELPKNPKRMSVDQADAALTQLGYARASAPQFDLTTKKMVWTMVDPSGQVVRLDSDEIAKVIYTSSDDPELRKKGTKQ